MYGEGGKGGRGECGEGGSVTQLVLSVGTQSGVSLGISRNK